MEKTTTLQKREIEMTAGWDMKPNYGQHGLEMRFIVRGSRGAVVFTIFTDWMPSGPVGMVIDGKPIFPMAADLGYHALEPQYDGQKKQRDCKYIGTDCYYDGSSLNGEPFLKALLNGGSEPVFDMLDGYYVEVFGERP